VGSPKKKKKGGGGEGGTVGHGKEKARPPTRDGEDLVCEWDRSGGEKGGKKKGPLVFKKKELAAWSTEVKG